MAGHIISAQAVLISSVVLKGGSTLDVFPSLTSISFATVLRSSFSSWVDQTATDFIQVVPIEFYSTECVEISRTMRGEMS